MALCDGLLERVKELMEKDKIQELTALYNLESEKINCVPVLSQGELYGRLAEGRLYRHFMAESFLPSFMKENGEEKKFVALRQVVKVTPFIWLYNCKYPRLKSVLNVLKERGETGIKF